MLLLSIATNSIQLDFVLHFSLFDNRDRDRNAFVIGVLAEVDLTIFGVRNIFWTRIFGIWVRTEMVAVSTRRWYRRKNSSVGTSSLNRSRKSCDDLFRLLMPTIGLMDIIIALICMLMEPSPLIYCWATVWGFSTAVMRPLSGESIFGLIERTGNFCPALALLWLVSGQLFNYYLTVCGMMIGGLIVSGFIFRQTGIFAK